MSLEWEQTIIDALDPTALGNWWRAALGWVIVNDEPDEFEIRPASDQLPGLLFVPASESKAGKNRLDIGQGEQSLVVLADPEGNEFCVLRSRSVSREPAVRRAEDACCLARPTIAVGDPVAYSQPASRSRRRRTSSTASSEASWPVTAKRGTRRPAATTMR